MVPAACLVKPCKCHGYPASCPSISATGGDSNQGFSMLPIFERSDWCTTGAQSDDVRVLSAPHPKASKAAMQTIDLPPATYIPEQEVEVCYNGADFPEMLGWGVRGSVRCCSSDRDCLQLCMHALEVQPCMIRHCLQQCHGHASCPRSYRIENWLVKQVMRAVHKGREIALKLAGEYRTAVTPREEREAQQQLDILLRLRHPCIVQASNAAGAELNSEYALCSCAQHA